MRFFPSHTLAVTLAILLAGCGGKSEVQHLDKAREALQRHDLRTAEIELKSVLQSQAGNVQARLLLAQTMQNKDYWEESEKELRKAQEHGASAEQTLPMLARALVKLGKNKELVDMKLPASGLGSAAVASIEAYRALAYLGLRQPNEALRTITEAERTLQGVGGADAYSGDLQLAKAYLAVYNSQTAEAQSILDAALQRDKNFTEALSLKADLLHMQGKLLESEKIYTDIIAQRPGTIMAYLAIIDSRMRARDLENAEKTMRLAEQANPKLLLVKYARAKLELLKGNPKQANEVLQQILKSAPNHFPSLLMDAEVSYDLGNYEQSLKSANKVLAQKPDHLQSARLVALNKLRMGDAQDAIAVLTPVLKANADNAGLLAVLGEAYLQTKQFSTALQYLDRAAAIQPQDTVIKENRARALLAMGREDQAVRELEQAASMNAKDTRAEHALVTLYLGRKNYDKVLAAVAAMEKKQPNNPAIYNIRGLAYVGKNDRASARKAFEKALATRPDFFPAAANLARLDMADKKPDDARKRYEGILKVNEKNVQAMTALAALADANKREQEAVDWLEKAAKADPASLGPRAALVRYYMNKKAPQKALTIANAMVSANPGNPQALIMLGAAQMATGDQTGALSNFSKAASIPPLSADNHLALAGAQIQAKKYEDARWTLRKVLEIQPGHLGGLDAMLSLEIADKKPEAALRMARQIQQLYPGNPVGYDREGDILASNKRYPEAIQAYRKALDAGAPTASLIKYLGSITASGDRQGAEKALQSWLAKHPKDGGARRYAAEFYTGAERIPEAIAQYEAIRGFDASDVSVLNNLAVLYQRAKDSRALATAEQAFKLAPEHPGVMDTLGWILVERGDYPRALTLLGSARAKAPKVGTIHYHYAVALARSGNKPEARKQLDQLLASDLKFPELQEAKALRPTL